MPAPRVVDREREPLGGRLQLVGLLGGQQRGGRLLDDLLVAPLDRAVADAERPRRALPVGDHLDLDVPGAGDQALQEDHAAAEGALGLVAGALVRVARGRRRSATIRMPRPPPPAVALSISG